VLINQRGYLANHSGHWTNATRALAESSATRKPLPADLPKADYGSVLDRVLQTAGGLGLTSHIVQAVEHWYERQKVESEPVRL
jgi:hypothetical protein